MDQDATGCSVRALREKIAARFGSNIITLVKEKASMDQSGFTMLQLTLTTRNTFCSGEKKLILLLWIIFLPGKSLLLFNFCLTHKIMTVMLIKMLQKMHE